MRMMVLVAVAGLASGATAQLGTGLIEWQVSADGGAAWASGLTEVPPEQGSVLVRARASWSIDGGMYAFAGSQFDVVVKGAAPGDEVTNARRSWPFTSGSIQTIVVQRFGDVLKVDDARDTLPPGEGPRGVFPGQLVPQFGTNFTTANPATIFEFTLQLDGSEGDRDLWSLYIAPPGGNTIDRVMRIYTSASGAQNTPSTTTRGVTIRVIPAPWAGTALLAAWGAMAPRRRSRA